MGFPTKVQLINRKESEQWYINFPTAIATAMDFAKGETVEWTIADKQHLILSRRVVPADPVEVKKKRRPPSAPDSGSSSPAPQPRPAPRRPAPSGSPRT